MNKIFKFKIKNLIFSVVFGLFALILSIASLSFKPFEGTSSLVSVTFNTGPGFAKISSECFKNSGLKEVVIPDYFTTLSSSAFYGCTSFNKVFFTSTTIVDIHLNMSDTTQQYVNATKYVYSATEPTDTDNNYWHYVEGEPTIWETA